MGTDLHLYAETRIDGEWRPIPEPAVNEFVPSEWDGLITPTPVFPEMGRPYRLFSLLSGNPIGITSRNAEIPAIGNGPRGFPADLNELFTRFFDDDWVYEDWADGGGDHGATWLLTREILAFDWKNETLVEHGFVEPEVAHLFSSRRFPSKAELGNASVLRDGWWDNAPPPPPHTEKVSWQTPLREWIGSNEEVYVADWFLDRIRRLGPPEDTRIIYWFNS